METKAKAKAKASQLNPRVTKWQGLRLKDTWKMSTLTVFDTSGAHLPKPACTYPEKGLAGLLSGDAMTSAI